eukprot:15476182-Alexandrium_andersonii.AAC.1
MGCASAFSSAAVSAFRALAVLHVATLSPFFRVAVPPRSGAIRSGATCAIFATGLRRRRGW